MNIITSSIVQNTSSINYYDIPQLPISGILLNNIQQFFDKMLPIYSNSISVNQQNMSYQYLFDQAARITNNNINIPIDTETMPL